MTLKEVNKEIDRLKVVQRELEEQEREAHRQAARQFVGKCYKSNKGNVIKIVGVPRTFVAMTHTSYNPYQFPAIFLQYAKMPRERYIHDDSDEFLPTYYDTVYLDIKKGIPCMNEILNYEVYQEITQEEFNVEFDKCIAHFKEQIGC